MGSVIILSSGFFPFSISDYFVFARAKLFPLPSKGVSGINKVVIMVVAVDRKTKKSAWAGGRNSLNTVGSFHSFLQTSNISSDEENGLNS